MTASFKEVPVETYDQKQVVVVVDGVKTITVEKVLRTEDPNKGYVAEDFSLQNLIDAGATDLLKPIAPLQRDVLSAADSAAVAVDAIADSAIVQPLTDVTNE